MIKRKLNEKGVSLIEVVAGIPLTIILFTTMILAMMHFVRAYQETKLYLQLQEDMFQAIETMRYGYAKEPETAGDGLIGLITAKEVIRYGPSSIELRPLLTNLTYNQAYKAFFRVNDDRHLEYEGYSGISDHIRPVVIFPSTPPKKIGRDWQFQILNPQDIWGVVDDNAEGFPILMRIRLEGQVRFREKSVGQNITEDKNKNTKTCIMETYVFMENATL
jgi:hypothetical protein